MARLEEQNAKLSLRLESRTLVERAKGILQSELGITESAAFSDCSGKASRCENP